MDSKHRHQLEQNELAKWIAAQYNDWIRPNSGWLIYAVLGVVVVIIIVVATSRVKSWNRATAWKLYYSALHSEQFETDLTNVADTTSGIVGVQARLALAQRQLSDGCSQVFVDKAKAIVDLEKAIMSFQQVQKATDDSVVLQQVGFGLGQCWEALAAARTGGDLENAETEYKNVIERWEDSFAGRRAKKQLELIQRPATRKFIELAAAKTIELPKQDDFKVNIDQNDPFATGQVDLNMFDKKIEEGDREPEKNEK